MDSWVVEEPKWHWMVHQLLSRFQQQGILCDTTLACANGEAVKAHSCILAAASQRIRSLLDGVQSGDYTLQMGCVTSSTWRYVLRFIYDGRVSLPSAEIQRVKDAAIRFQITPLVELIQSLERLQNQENASGVENSNIRPFHVQQGSSEIIVLDDDDEIMDLNISGNPPTSTGTELLCSNGSCPVSVDSYVSEIVNMDSTDEIGNQPKDSPTAGSNLEMETSAAGRDDESSIDVGKQVDLHDVSDVIEDSRPHDANCDSSEVDVMTISNSVESSLLEKRNESSDFLSKLIVPVSCFANNLNSEIVQRNSLSQQSGVFSHSTTDLHADQMNSDFTRLNPLNTDNHSNVCHSVVSLQMSSDVSSTFTTLTSDASVSQNHLSGVKNLHALRDNDCSPADEQNAERDREENMNTDLYAKDIFSKNIVTKSMTTSYDLLNQDLSPVFMDSSTEGRDEIEPMLCISDVVSLSGQTSEFVNFQPDPECSSSGKFSEIPSESNVVNINNNLSSVAFAHQTAPSSNTSFAVLVPASAPVLSNSGLIIPEDQLSKSVIKAKIVKNSRKTPDKSGVIGPNDGKLVLRNFFAAKKNEQIHSSAPTPVLLISRPETQNLNNIVTNNTLPHDGTYSTIIRPHVIEPICDVIEPRVIEPIRDVIEPRVIEPVCEDGTSVVSSLPEPRILQNNQSKFVYGIVPTSVALSCISVSLPVEEFGSVQNQNLPAVSLRMPHSFSVSQPRGIRPQLIAPGLNNTIPRLKRPALLRHPNKSSSSVFANTAPVPRKRTCKSKVSSKNDESCVTGGLNTVQKSASAAALGSSLVEPTPGTSEYSWPGDRGLFNGCSKLISDGSSVHQTPADQSSSTVKYRRRKISFAGIRSDNELKLTSGLDSSADHNYFMQPDSTVNDSQALQQGIDVYNFTDSEVDSSGQKKGLPLLKGATKASKGPRNKLRYQKSSPAKSKLDDSRKSQGSKKQKPGRRRKIPLEEQSLSTADGSGIQFVGKQIRHEWVISNNPRTTRWYTGRVVRLVRGTDGESGSQYEVQYEGDDTYLVDHLLDDYKDGSLVLL